MDDPVARTRAAIARDGVDAIVIDDLAEDDVSRLAWSGSRLHLESVRSQLERMRAGTVEYLVARAPGTGGGGGGGGEPVAKGGVDYEQEPGAGVIWQLATHPSLQGLGLGTRLIACAEQRIVARGLPRAVIGVEPDNVGAQRLYERLGYVEFRRRESGWEAEQPDGTTGWYSTTIVDMEKAVG